MVEWSRASYLIDVLGMPKVEGSNPDAAVIFRAEKLNYIGNGRTRTQCACANERINSFAHAQRNLDFRTFGSDMKSTHESLMGDL